MHTGKDKMNHRKGYAKFTLFNSYCNINAIKLAKKKKKKKQNAAKKAKRTELLTAL